MKMNIEKVKTGNVVFGDPEKFVFIGGPCVIESEKSVMFHAEKITEIANRLKIPYVFKASYDKANRSSSKSYRGPGIEEGLKILARVKREFQVPVLSDVHETQEIQKAKDVLDIIQIPAFLCRQTSLLFEAGKTGCAVNVKKGQFLSPWEAGNIVQKLKEVGCQKILLTERGFSFGYQNLVSDFRSIPIMRDFGVPVIYDATHSVQIPGGKGNASGGMAEFIPTLSRCGIAAGADAVFMEVHENPAEALSDGPNALKLSKLQDLLENLMEIKTALSRSKVRL